MSLARFDKDFATELRHADRPDAKIRIVSAQLIRALCAFVSRAMTLKQPPVSERVLRDMGIAPAKALPGAEQVCVDPAGQVTHAARPTAPML